MSPKRESAVNFTLFAFLLSETKMSAETARDVRLTGRSGECWRLSGRVRRGAFPDMIKDPHEQAGRLDRFGRFWRIAVAGLPMASRLQSTA